VFDDAGDVDRTLGEHAEERTTIALERGHPQVLHRLLAHEAPAVDAVAPLEERERLMGGPVDGARDVLALEVPLALEALLRRLDGGHLQVEAGVLAHEALLAGLEGGDVDVLVALDALLLHELLD